MTNAWLAMGLIFGVLMIWFGILIAIICRPLAKGEIKGHDYNYRPWRPKFVKALSVEELDKINQQSARWMLAYSLFMVFLGVCAIILGIMSIVNPAILYLVAISMIAILIIGVFVYVFYFARRKTIKAD